MQPFFIFKNEDISFLIVREKNRLFLLQPKWDLPLNDSFPLIPFLPQNDSCLVDAVARTNITGRPDSSLVQFAQLKTFIPPFFWKQNIPRFLVSLHKWNSHFSFGETGDANAYSWAGFTELGSGLDKRIPLSLQHDSKELAVVTYHHIYLGGELCQGLSTGQIQSHPNQLGFGDVFKPKRTRACLGQRAQVLSSLQTRHKPPTTKLTCTPSTTCR